MRRAATLGDGRNPYMCTPEQTKESFSAVKAMADEAGRTLPDDVGWACFSYCCMDDNVAKARQKAIEVLSYRYDQPFEKIVDKYVAFGPPSKIVETLSRYVKAGATKILTGLIMPPDEPMPYLESFAKEVLPELRKLTPGKVI